MSFNKFKINEIILVNGFGKKDKTLYKNKIGIIICKDPYFKDYNINLLNGSDDWFDEKDLKKIIERNEKI